MFLVLLSSREMYFARENQDEAICHLKLRLRVFSLSDPKDDRRKVDEDVDEAFADLTTIQRDL